MFQSDAYCFMNYVIEIINVYKNKPVLSQHGISDDRIGCEGVFIFSILLIEDFSVTLSLQHN